MKKMVLPLFLILSGCLGSALGQTCKELGQNPGTAFPVCGTTTFSQDEVPICGNRDVPSPCGNAEITDKNPFWYKFTCYTSGTLGFLITPENLKDDYDWQLFDITGRLPADVYSQKSLFVSCNWSGESGVTGASADGTSLSICEGLGKPLFSSMPTITEGREYLLLVSHFTETQSGYELKFEGGTADITDPRIPVMESVTGDCNGRQIRMKLNKRLKCSSLATDGSDFFLPSGEASIISAMSPKCSSSFDMDSVVLTLDRTLPPGNYSVDIKAGSDGNTLLDNCDQEMPPGVRRFTIYPDVSAAFEYNVLTGCKNDTIHLQHTGGSTTTRWFWQFDDNTVATTKNTVKLYSGGGNRNMRLIVANDHCSDTSSVAISLPEKIKAAFEAPEIICKKDKAVFTDKSTGNIAQWHWDFGNGSNNTRQRPDPFNYTSSGREESSYKVILDVTGPEGCTDTATATVIVISSCVITVPTAFTPNNDGRNDYLFPTNAFNATNMIFRVFNRFGQIVFESRDWQQKWDGTVNGRPQNTGTYVWTLNYTLKTSGKPYSLKGTTLLIR